MKEERQVKSTNILRIYDRLRQSPVTLDVLYDWVSKAGMDVSRRTLYRYLDDLASSITFPGEKLVVYDNEFNKKVWKIEYEQSTKLLSQFDINSYYMLRHFLPASLTQPRAESLQKLDAMMYELASKSRFQVNVDANNLAFLHSGYIDAIYTHEDHLILEDIIWAVQHHRKIKIEEFNFDKMALPEGFEVGMEILPLRMVYHFGTIFLCGFSEIANAVIALPFSDITKVSTTNNSFNPALFQGRIEEYLKKQFGLLKNYDDEVYDIEIEFATYTGKYISTVHWHSSQRMEWLPNGNLLMKLHCGINRELIGFIFYFLNNAMVRKPLILRDMVIQRLEKTLSTYERNEMVYEAATLP